jgi:hypothetical protein
MMELQERVGYCVGTAHLLLLKRGEEAVEFV